MLQQIGFQCDGVRIKLGICSLPYAYSLTVCVCMRERARAHTHTVTGNEGPRGEEMYSSTLSLTWAQDGVGGQRLTFGKETWYPLCRRLGGPQCWF
jgi:hypothetical protein